MDEEKEWKKFENSGRITDYLCYKNVSGLNFQELRANFEGAYYGMYFMELAQYYTRENVDETKMLKLLYQSLRALLNKTIDNELVRYIYEIKAMVINGEFPGVPKHLDVDPLNL